MITVSRRDGMKQEAISQQVDKDAAQEWGCSGEASLLWGGVCALCTFCPGWIKSGSIGWECEWVVGIARSATYRLTPLVPAI